MTQSQRLGDVGVVGHRQDATGCGDMLSAYDHGSIVERRVLKEDILDEALRDISVDVVTGVDVFVEPNAVFDDNQGPHVSFAHVHTCHHDGKDVFVAVIGRTFGPEEANQVGLAMVDTDGGEETTYFFLKQDDQRECSHINDSVENGSKQSEIEELLNNDPYENKDDDAGEDVGGTRLLHETVDVVEKQCYQEDIDEIF